MRKTINYLILSIIFLCLLSGTSLAARNRPIMITVPGGRNVTGVTVFVVNNDVIIEDITFFSTVPTTGQYLVVDAAGTGIKGIDITSEVTGSGAVNTGAYKQMAWYNTVGEDSGATVGPLTNLANAVLVTSGTSVPSISQTLPNAVQLNITALGSIAATATAGVSVFDIAGNRMFGIDDNNSSGASVFVRGPSSSGASLFAVFNFDGKTLMVVKGNGTVCIGCTNPAITTGLEIFGLNPTLRIADSGGSDPVLSIFRTGSAGWTFRNDQSNSDIYEIRWGSLAVFNIDTEGNVLINNNTESGATFFIESETATSAVTPFAIGDGTGKILLMVSGDGNIIIGAGDLSGATLFVKGAVLTGGTIFAVATSGNTLPFLVEGSGSVVFSGDSGGTVYLDAAKTMGWFRSGISLFYFTSNTSKDLGDM